MKRIWIVVILVGLLLAGFTGIQAQVARLQAIHNMADPQLDTVDVYISLPPFGQLAKLEDVPFRTATPFVDALAGVLLAIGIAPANSATVNDTLKNFNVTLVDGRTYVGVVNGVLDPNQFVPNPNGRDISLGFVLNDSARETSTVPGEVQFFLVHGATDLPTVDVEIRGGALLVDNITYGDFSPYVSLTPANYILEIKDAMTGNLVRAYQVDLSALADSALTFVLSGFLDPGANQNGAPLALFGVRRDSTVILFPEVTTGIGDGAGEPLVQEFALFQNYPNPFNPTTNLRFRISDFGLVELKVYDGLGREIATLVNEKMAPGMYEVQWDARDDTGKPVSSGVYLYRLKAGNFTATRKMVLMR